MNTLNLTVCWLTFLVLADSAAVLNIKLQKPTDKAVTTAAKTGVVITITSKSGIGSATVTAKGDWPKTIVIRFANLQGLEGFTVKNMAGSFQTFLKNRKAVIVTGSRAKIAVPIQRLKAGIEVTLPRDWIAKHRSFEMRWVDFYRG